MGVCISFEEERHMIEDPIIKLRYSNEARFQSIAAARRNASKECQDPQQGPTITIDHQDQGNRNRSSRRNSIGTGDASPASRDAEHLPILSCSLSSSKRHSLKDIGSSPTPSESLASPSACSLGSSSRGCNHHPTSPHALAAHQDTDPGALSPSKRLRNQASAQPPTDASRRELLGGSSLRSNGKEWCSVCRRALPDDCTCRGPAREAPPPASPSRRASRSQSPRGRLMIRLLDGPAQGLGHGQVLYH